MKRKLLSIAAVAGLLIGSTAIVQAQSRGGMSGGPGAPGFAPGHQDTTGAGDRDRDDRMGRGDRDDRIRRGDRDHDDDIRDDRDDRTTGFGGRDRDDRLRDDRDDRMMDNDSRGIDKD
jgi:hypothetical protein